VGDDVVQLPGDSPALLGGREQRTLVTVAFGRARPFQPCGQVVAAGAGVDPQHEAAERRAGQQQQRGQQVAGRCPPHCR
jgi:hypothetical protein